MNEMFTYSYSILAYVIYTCTYIYTWICIYMYVLKFLYINVLLFISSKHLYQCLHIHTIPKYHLGMHINVYLFKSFGFVYQCKPFHNISMYINVNWFIRSIHKYTPIYTIQVCRPAMLREFSNLFPKSKNLYRSKHALVHAVIVFSSYACHANAYAFLFPHICTLKFLYVYIYIHRYVYIYIYIWFIYICIRI